MLKLVAVGCVQLICAVCEVNVVVIPVIGVHSGITLTLSTNQVSPLVPVVPV